MRNPEKEGRMLERNILMVNASGNDLNWLKEGLEKKGFGVEMAMSYTQAIEFIQERDPAKLEAVLTEGGQMGMSGLEMIDWMKSVDNALSVIMMAPRGESAVLEAALRRGATDFVEMPADVEKIAHAVEVACEKTVRARQLNTAEKNIRAVARLNHLFRSVLAPELLPQLQMHHTAHDQVGGDFVNVLPMTGGKHLLLVGDVSGHDLRAGFVSAYFQGLVRGLSHDGKGIVEICNSFNKILCQEWEHRTGKNKTRVEPRTSLSLLAVEIDHRENKALVVNCGAPSVRIAYTDGREEKMQELNMPLGWSMDEKILGEEISLNGVGYLFLATDGLHDWAQKLGNSSMGLAYRLLEKHENPVGTPPDDLLLLRYQHTPVTPGEELWHPLGRAVKAEYTSMREMAERLQGLLKLNLKNAPPVERVLAVMEAEKKEVEVAGIAVRPKEGTVKMRMKFVDGSVEQVRVLGVN